MKFFTKDNFKILPQSELDKIKKANPCIVDVVDAMILKTNTEIWAKEHKVGFNYDRSHGVLNGLEELKEIMKELNL